MSGWRAAGIVVVLAGITLLQTRRIARAA